MTYSPGAPTPSQRFFTR